MVLWLTAALSAIAFSVATHVRSETERTSTEVDALKTYYIASGAIDRAMLWMEWGQSYHAPDGTALYYQPPMPLIRYEFPEGHAEVEVIPETSKLNINSARPEELMSLLAALSVPPERASLIMNGILDWRAPTPGGSFSQFDEYYLSLTPSFRARHTSFEEIEELLLVEGMTPEIFYGHYDKDAEGRMIPRIGLKDCVTVYGPAGPFDVNTVQPAVMYALGVPPDTVANIVALRRLGPIRTLDQIKQFTQSPAVSRLGIGSGLFFTFRATASARTPNGTLSDLRRSVSALVAIIGPNYNPPFHVMRWYDNAFMTQ
ncbi:MAG TPA: hypothetical protein VKU01_17270 [Bryobacteraceae bacterium]|nr:hypothetical protein [Bryobacteraceae bacterium]